MSKTYFTILAISLFLIISGCSNDLTTPRTVHAAPPPAPYPGGCPSASGSFGDSKEVPGSNIALLDTPCGLIPVPKPIETDTQTLDSCGKDQVVTQAVTQDIHVHAIRLWIGASLFTKFENGVCLEVVTNGVVTKTFRREWDKHVEEHYDDAPFPVDFIIPAGSVVRLSRDPHSTSSCLDGVNSQGVVDGKTTGVCLTQEMAELWGD